MAVSLAGQASPRGGKLLVPWPAYKETNKWMIKLNFLVSKDRKYHQVYQASISQFRFESASRLAC